MHRMNGITGQMSAGPNLWFILMMIFIMGLIVIGIVLVVQYLRKDDRKEEQLEKHSDSALKPIEIIQERLAKGEIDVEEYEQLKETLEKS